MTPRLRALRQWLEGHHSGPIADTASLERLLADSWHEFSGDHGGMEGRKLLGRMEGVEWNPPILSFTIERHGGTALGSSRAELQQWTLDIDRRTATCETVSHRQLRPMQRRLNVVPLAEEIVRLILERRADDRLKWNNDGSVRVLVGKVLPEGSAVKQTLIGRRQRFRKALVERLEAEGWGLSAYPYTFAS